MECIEEQVIIIKEKLVSLERRLNEVEELSFAITKLYNELSKMNTSLQVLVSEFDHNKVITIENQNNLRKIVEKPMNEFSIIKTGVLVSIIVLVFQMVFKYIQF